MKEIFVRLYSKAINIIFPKKCIFCGKCIAHDSEILACGDCMRNLPLERNKRCFEVRWKNVSFVAAPFEYNKFVRRAIHLFKFSERSHYAKTFAYFMNDVLKDVLKTEAFDVVIPVPLGKKALRKRGYNQSELMAYELDGLSDIVDTEALIKVKEKGAQSKKESQQRIRDIKGCFKCVKNLNGARVLLVDDVCTTGATLSTCADELLKMGASRVCCVTAAKTKNKEFKQRPLCLK